MTDDTIRVHTEGPNAFENAKNQLQAQNADPERISEVDVEITVEEQKALPSKNENKGDEGGNVDEMDVLRRFMQLGPKTIKRDDGRNIGCQRAYPALRFIEDNATKDAPVQAADVRDATGLGNGASSLLSDLNDAGLVNRYQPEAGNRKPYVYTGLTKRGKAELERCEEIITE